MLLNLSDLSSEPLYRQILRQIRAQIINGQVSKGAPILSIRDLARSHKVSVITVQKAYDELVREGLLIARRGKGYFVAELAKADRAAIAKMNCMEALRVPIATALNERVSPNDIKLIVEELIKNIKNS